MGSFGNMYVSIENLSATYLQPNVTKESHLKLKVYIFETGDSLSYCQTLNWWTGERGTTERDKFGHFDKDVKR